MPSGVYKRTKEHKRKLSNALKGRKFSREWKRRISEANKGHTFGMKGKFHSNETRHKMSVAGKERKFSDETKRKISIALKGRKREPLSKETKRKLRLSAIQRIERDRLNGNQLIPRFNSIACQLIDEYGKQHGYNFQHPMNGGEFHIKELGYWVDGYDKTQNVVIEYYERRHLNHIEKDEQRKQEIIKHLGCKFIVLNENKYD